MQRVIKPLILPDFYFWVPFSLVCPLSDMGASYFVIQSDYDRVAGTSSGRSRRMQELGLYRLLLLKRSLCQPLMLHSGFQVLGFQVPRYGYGAAFHLSKKAEGCVKETHMKERKEIMLFLRNRQLGTVVQKR